MMSKKRITELEKKAIIFPDEWCILCKGSAKVYNYITQHLNEIDIINNVKSLITKRE